MAYFCAIKSASFSAECTPLVKPFLQCKLTPALAESCTCGLVAAQLAPAEGVRDVLLGSVVTYHALATQKLLGGCPETIEVYSAESQQTTNEMVPDLREADVAAQQHVGSSAHE